jgi:hypothetical protein
MYKLGKVILYQLLCVFSTSVLVVMARTQTLDFWIVRQVFLRLCYHSTMTMSMISFSNMTIQHENAQHNNTQHNDTQHYDTQHDNGKSWTCKYMKRVTDI